MCGMYSILRFIAQLLWNDMLYQGTNSVLYGYKFGLDDDALLITLMSTVSIATVTSWVFADVITVDKGIPSLYVRKNMSFVS